jgi:site-specific recombinase XerD
MAVLNLHAESTKSDPMTRHTFDKLLRTYVGEGWTLKRLRDTCAAAWVRSGMPLEYLRELLGLSRIEETLPYARLVRGSLDGRMKKLDTIFTDLVQPADTAA